MTIAPPVITIDGPSGAGKGTLCRALARQLGWHLLDSGLLYRLLALIVIQQSMDVTVEDQLVVLAEQLAGQWVVTPDTLQVYLAGEDVTQQLASEQVGRVASQVAALPGVRTALLQQQRAFRQFPGLVADGRDMGRVIFPDAVAKIFLYASLEERARRRVRQLQEKGFDVKFAQVLKEIRERDYNDTHRRVAALAAAEGALLLDSTAMPLEQVIERALRYIHQNTTINPSSIQTPTTGSVGQ